MSDSSSANIPSGITRPISGESALCDLPIPPRLVPVASPQFPPSYSKPCLSIMPPEVKALIIEYLQHLDIQEKIKSLELKPGQIEYLHFDPCGLDSIKLEPWSSFFHFEIMVPRRSSIKALASVDRSFYHFCQPWIWKFLDLDNLDNSQLEKLLSDILPLHRHHVRSLWWRCFHTLWDPFHGPTQCEKISDQIRNKLFLQILRVCPHLIRLDVDISEEILGVLNPCDLELFKNAPEWVLFEPLPRLTALTSLHLAPPSSSATFNETDLIPFLRETPNLTSFSCIGIRPSFPLDSCPGLGFHLASLNKLQNLTLSQAECIDSSWAALDWKGPIRSLSLSNCLPISLHEFLALVQKFSNTLLRLQIANSVQHEFHLHHRARNLVPWISDDSILDLPQLTHLILPDILNPLIVRLVSKFLGCKALKKVYIGPKSPVDYNELITLIENIDKHPPRRLDIEDFNDLFDYSHSIIDEDGFDYSDSITEEEWYPDSYDL
ncbi:hypothetical protein O181_013567 [Austropuccinia psidii MF-1]|uniref:F-box domain-containing protein n=1 Tax=Austropuccinia psidii MF-1 TaxID=1389203 RepID=A0A9Q3BZW8_9BASI|nr:hypothetical protein [Austropuccinia psidii MF-1]